MSKKNTTVKTATKKEKAPKPVAVKIKKEVVPKYKLVTFGMKATIPTQMYGNIMPEIVIKAKNIEEAKAILMPAIESLYIAYCEKPRDGSSLPFMSRSSITVEEKKVEVPKPVVKAPVIEKEEKKEGVLGSTSPTPKGPTGPTTPSPTPKGPTGPEQSAQELADDLSNKSPAFIKARTAITGSTSLDALGLIEDQIQKSVKLTAEEKPILLTEVLKKRKTFA